jgi:hypothetical protein
MAPIQRSPGQLLDTRRFGAAVGFPGIDPRHWISLAIVTAVEIDPVEGPFVACTLLPSQQQVSARVGSGYAGGGFGDWCPIRVDDEVLIEAPDGEAQGGYIVTARLWSPADAPPELMVSNPNDRLIQALDGQNVRVVATGAGAVNLDAPAVNLGSDEASQEVPLGNNLINALFAGLDAMQLACVGPLAPLKAPIQLLIQGLGETPTGGSPPPPGTPAVLSTVTKTE